MNALRVISAAACLALISGTAMAEGPFDGAIKARQSLMRLSAKLLGILSLDTLLI